MPDDSRYKMFRNFMVNELGISREDIKEWTKQAVSEQVTKLVGQINIGHLVEARVKQVLGGGYDRGGVINEAIRAAVQDHVSKSIVVSLKSTR